MHMWFTTEVIWEQHGKCWILNYFNLKRPVDGVSAYKIQLCRKGAKQTTTKKNNEINQIFISRQFLILRVQKAAGNKQKEKFVLTANQIQNVENHLPDEAIKGHKQKQNLLEY